MSEQVSERELWGGETRKAVANFPVSGEPIPVPVARWLGRVKAAAARANAELRLLDPDKAGRIAEAADRVAAGELDDQFPIDVFQTGSGTSSNMNANEVIATLAGEDVHANDDVNLGQSSNDVFPTAVHLAALDEKCVAGIQANREQCERYAELTLAAATGLNPYIGYDKATEIVKEASTSGRPLREVARDAGVSEEILDEALDYRALAKPHDS